MLALCVFMASKRQENIFHPDCFKQNDNAVFRRTMIDLPLSCVCPEHSVRRPTMKYLQSRLHTFGCKAWARFLADLVQVVLAQPGSSLR